jgi:hypothetical protein
MIRDAKRHQGRTAQGFVNTAQIVETHPKRNRRLVVLKLLLKSRWSAG